MNGIIGEKGINVGDHKKIGKNDSFNTVNI